jgi:hypothetical protein
VNQVRRPFVTICDDNDSTVVSRIVAATAAHVSDHNISSNGQPLRQERMFDRRKWPRREVADRVWQCRHLFHSLGTDPLLPQRSLRWRHVSCIDVDQWTRASDNRRAAEFQVANS